MKKLFAIVLIVALCMTMAAPVLAAQDDFTPSITYKPAPEFAGEQDTDGCQIIGYVEVNEEIVGKIHYDGEEIYAIVEAVHDDACGDDHRCLVLTPLAEAETSEHIPEESRSLLLWVYDQLLKLGMSFIDCPELDEKIKKELGEDKTVEDLVVRDLFDVSVLCEPLEEWLEPEGNVICLDFDLKVKDDDFVAIVAYKNDQWKMIKDVKVNEKGNLTCTTYENFCPIAILMAETDVSDMAPETGVSNLNDLTLWVLIGAGALIALIAVVVIQRKRGAAR